MVTVKIKKLSPDAFVPQQMSEGAAGFDLAVLDDTVILSNKFSSIACIAHTGVALDIPKGYYGEITIRSSIGRDTKVRLANQVGIIDSDYRGEILLYLENIGTSAEIIKAGARVAQIIFKKYEAVKLDVVDVLSETKRGVKGTGSTGA